MIQLPRARPSEIPAIQPVPEYAVSGERASRYADMKQVLQVPWMGVVTMAYAHYPIFFDALWRGLRPLYASTEFVRAAQVLRTLAQTGTQVFATCSISARLEASGYDAPEIAAIRETIKVFSHGNPLHLLIATIVRLLLEGARWANKATLHPLQAATRRKQRCPLF